MRTRTINVGTLAATFRRAARRDAKRAAEQARTDAVLAYSYRRSVADAFADLTDEHGNGGTFTVADLLAECGEDHVQYAGEILARAHSMGGIVLTKDQIFVADMELATSAAYQGLGPAR